MPPVSKISGLSVENFLETARTGKRVIVKEENGKTSLVKAGILDRLQSFFGLGQIRERENVNTLNAFKQALKQDPRYEGLGDSIGILTGQIATQRPLASWKVTHVVDTLNTLVRTQNMQISQSRVSALCSLDSLRDTLASEHLESSLGFASRGLANYLADHIKEHEDFKDHNFHSGPVSQKQIDGIFKKLIGTLKKYEQAMAQRNMSGHNRILMFEDMVQQRLPLQQTKQAIAQDVDQWLEQEETAKVAIRAQQTKAQKDEAEESKPGGQKADQPDAPGKGNSDSGKEKTIEANRELARARIRKLGGEGDDARGFMYMLKREGLSTSVGGFTSSDMRDCVLRSIMEHEKVKTHDFGKGPLPDALADKALQDVIETINAYNKAMIQQGQSDYDRFVLLQELTKYGEFTPQPEGAIEKYVTNWIEQRQDTIEKLRNTL